MTLSLSDSERHSKTHKSHAPYKMAAIQFQNCHSTETTQLPTTSVTRAIISSHIECTSWTYI